MAELMCSKCGKCLSNGIHLKVPVWVCPECGNRFQGRCSPDRCPKCQTSYARQDQAASQKDD